jgi:hypothetical protein
VKLGATHFEGEFAHALLQRVHCRARLPKYVTDTVRAALPALGICGQVERRNVQGRFESINEHARIGRPSDKPGRIARLPRAPAMLADVRDGQEGNCRRPD